ncbi:hypothetical protein [Aneurinibacillus sp. REN35]
MAKQTEQRKAPIVHYGPRFEQCKKEAMRYLARQIVPAYQEKLKKGAKA